MKNAIITGGAGGLGLALAKKLQADGWRTFLLDINIANIDDTPSQTPIEIDLTNSQSLQKIASKILDECSSIDLVIYNAGITQIGCFSDLSSEAHRKVFEINYFSAVELARAFLGPIRASKGTHLAISSVAGFSPLTNRTAYCASKHALEGFFKTLRSEEAPFGVTTIIASPSFVATNIGNDQRQPDGTARPGSASDGIDYMTPEAAAEVILQGLKKKKDFVPVGRVARLSWWINSLSPRLFRRLMERNFRD